MERSRSGNGGHVWIFFDKPYPAYKSRKIVISLLVEAGVVSAYDKITGFDRYSLTKIKFQGKALVTVSVAIKWVMPEGAE